MKTIEVAATVDYDYSDFHLIMHCYTCEIAGGNLKLNVHNDVKWLKLNELKNQKWIPADVLVVGKLCEIR